jgi:hypothetical protein
MELRLSPLYVLAPGLASFYGGSKRKAILWS